MKELSDCIIMVVDDSEQNIDILIENLGEEYDIMVSLNGESALKILEKKVPDLILLDIVLPGIDGYEICKKIKNNKATSNVPVIFITGINSTEEKNRGFELGAVDYIVRPYDVSEVKARIKTHLSLKIAQEALKNQNKMLEINVEERTKELKYALEKIKKASLETVLHLSKAAEYRDDNTGNHVIRVSHYSAIIARKLGFNEEEVQIIMQAAPMHDIGKIGIPDSILLKQGKLDNREWEVMKTHAEIGSEILRDSEIEALRLGEQIAYTHHEKWNGTGYPLGLEGEEIPLSSRIVALADVFDALTTERPYKKEFSIDKACSIIKEESGRHFDPELVNIFFECLDEIIEVKNKYKDS